VRSAFLVEWGSGESSIEVAAAVRPVVSVVSWLGSNLGRSLSGKISFPFSTIPKIPLARERAQKLRERIPFSG